MGQDTKRLITGMIVALGVLMAYNFILHQLYPNWKPGQTETPTPPATQVASTQGTPSTTQTTTGASTQIVQNVTTAPAQAAWHARGGDGGMPASLGSMKHEDPKFAMAVEVARKGAAIDSVTLNQFFKSADDALKTPYSFEVPDVVDGNVRDDTRALQTRSITIDTHEVDLADVSWKLEKSDASSATFSVDILNGDKPVARVIKTYQLSPRSDDPKTSEGYVLNISQKVENLTDREMKFKTIFNGPTAPPRELERQPDQSFIFGYWFEGSVKVESHMLESEFSKDHTWKEFTRDEKSHPLFWGGAQSAYFNAIVKPIPFGNDATPTWITKVYGELLNPSATEADDRRVVMRFETGDMIAPPKGSMQFDLENYFGPKGRKILNTDYYSAASRRYDETLVIAPTSGFAKFCGMCTFQWLINLLVMLLTAFHFVLRDWGLSIICLVLLVRLLLHPITKKSQVHMVKMQKMGPEMEKLKKKYADDKDALAKAQMQFYKEQGMTPILGCLPMFLQMPIWIALWNCLQSTFELRHAPFLYGFTWIKDLSKPDYLIHFSQPVPLYIFGWHLTGLNILPLLMAVVMYMQSKYQPKPMAATPEQIQQQKMMVWMSTLLFPLMLYTGPSGLNLYIMTSTAFGIIESRAIRKHIKEREELEKLGPTIIDAPPPAKGGKERREVEEPKKKNWLARLQEKAEQIKNEGDKRKR
jgi:YidC/Oxa1 family membrane protein insertase